MTSERAQTGKDGSIPNWNRIPTGPVCKWRLTVSKRGMFSATKAEPLTDAVHHLSGEARPEVVDYAGVPKGVPKRFGCTYIDW